MKANPEQLQTILNRLKRTEGQIRGVQNMIESDKECIDIVTQLSAIRSSIDSTIGIIVADNLRQCIENPTKNSEEKQAMIQQATKMIIKK